MRRMNPLKTARALSFLIVTGASLAYFSWFSVTNDYWLSNEVHDWGVFGDFLNPFITLATLIWLGTAVYIQQNELKTALQSLRGASEAQTESVRVQRAAAELTALASKLSALQGDIQTLRSEVKYYAESNSTLSLSTAKTYQSRGKEIIRVNEELSLKLRERDDVIMEIDLLIGNKLHLPATAKAASSLR